MLDPFLTFINQHKLDLKKQPCLLTVSGGVDSVVMLHLFQKAGFPAGVAHCNFGLREEESEGDEQFVKTLANASGFPFYSKRFNVKSFAKEKGISTQMAARDLRYGWFEELRAGNNYSYIATAHHANDSLETTLLNLTRGTGLAGLHGISGINNHLLRPLLFATKEQILAYAQENGLQWREDRSNDSDDYKRNLVRHKVIPVLKELNPSLESTFNHSSAKLRSADQLLKEMLDDWAAGVVVKAEDQIRISKTMLILATEPAYRLWHILQDYGFAYSQVEKIINSLTGVSGKFFHSASHELLIDRENLILKKTAVDESNGDIQIVEEQHEVDLVGRHIILSKKIQNTDEGFLKSRSSVSINLDKVIFPLTIRKWKPGDVFQPLGMNGKQKKLSDLFIDSKMDQFTKKQTLVLLNGNGEIMWVVGVRLDERYKIHQGVTHILQVTFVDNR
ncbi:tRNA lysidine(34) synthetase TilS [Dyadobacter psychrophilus]|uniref:tRNA(Ile)-lysidine synthase n=1 Tax=Dyadobacter psychrophilus TaxID=651661 RepID=A0A1T5BY35_9BACT|nr:tRNA lysidine(34) synthetase TilS [Dyadobacter psychrophilus]SKB52282.1 tRNA(Ile)-lysidine synthase [Dyadobacter psychrophilus]